MAMIGVVPTNLLVRYLLDTWMRNGACRSSPFGGAIKGKAMGRLDSGTGVIEVGLTLQ